MSLINDLRAASRDNALELFDEAKQQIAGIMWEKTRGGKYEQLAVQCQTYAGQQALIEWLESEGFTPRAEQRQLGSVVVAWAWGFTSCMAHGVDGYLAANGSFNRNRG